ncbi:MAG: GNAT family N-acetyltransferase [bacterium]|jgi:GNAT superfamily N-acetyltransferase
MGQENMINIRVRDRVLAIRPIGKDDADAVLKVYRQCEDFLASGPVPTASLDMVAADIERSRKSGGVFCGIYSADGEMIGIIDYVPGHFDGDPEVAFIALLMIAASQRNKGIGTAVVEAIERKITEGAPVSMILSGVQVCNRHAIRFWQTQGYRIVGGPEVLPDHTTVYRLRKDVYR